MMANPWDRMPLIAAHMPTWDFSLFSFFKNGNMVKAEVVSPNPFSLRELVIFSKYMV
jgi:hypothetical protein